MFSKKASLGSCVLALVAAGASPAAAEGWSFAAGIDYSTGSYGQAQDTTIIEAPLTATYTGDRWGVSLTVPYVSVDGPGGIVPGGIGPAGGGLLGGVLGAGESAGVAGPNISEQGLGDVTASAFVTPVQTQSGGALTLAGRVRLPTGDEQKSLGIGETAVAVSLFGRQSFAERAGVYGAIGYEQTLESERGGMFAAAGVESYVSDNLLLGVRADWVEASAQGRRDSAQASLYAGIDVGERTRLLAYAGAGLSDSSPDASAGIAIVFKAS